MGFNLAEALRNWGSDYPGAPGEKPNGGIVRIRRIGSTFVVNVPGTTINTPVTQEEARALSNRFQNVIQEEN